jgi:hypothetical protein
MLRCVAPVRTDVSEKLGAYFNRVKKIGELWTTQAATSNRRTLRKNTPWNTSCLQQSGVGRLLPNILCGSCGGRRFGRACGIRRLGGRGWRARGGVGDCCGPTRGRGASVSRLLVAAYVIPGSPVLVALVGGGVVFLRGVGSCGGRAARHPEDAVRLCYISFLSSFSFLSVVFCVIFIFDV